ncbi:MAG: hypothetical protein PHU43_00300 [Candidatus Bipolaricaulis sp.]|nr:hypothetical protein [Candidatus Bipolaricaulis sp.]
MRVDVLEEHGYESALLGLSLSYRQEPERMAAVARRLRFLGEGHNKYLESIVVWLDMTAPRYFWQQFDTYRVGVTKQSESTMHTLTSRPLAQDDFAHPVPPEYLDHLNRLIAANDWEEAKAGVPESLLQRRVVCLNYMVLQRMIRQRKTHRLPEWHLFVARVLEAVQHPELLEDGGGS